MEDVNRSMSVVSSEGKEGGGKGKLHDGPTYVNSPKKRKVAAASAHKDHLSRRQRADEPTRNVENLALKRNYSISGGRKV